MNKNKIVITKEMISEIKEFTIFKDVYDDLTYGVGKYLIDCKELNYYVELTINTSISYNEEQIIEKLERAKNLKYKMFKHIFNKYIYISNYSLFEIDDENEFIIEEDTLKHLKDLQKEIDTYLEDGLEEQSKQKTNMRGY